MALGTQFLSLITRTRAEVRRSITTSTGVDDLDNIKRVINHVYRSLTIDYEWPHLRTVPVKITMAAGQQYYNVPSTLEYDGITEAVCWSGTENFPIDRGIDINDYALFNPADDERQDPVTKWDLVFTGATVQIEVWPLPATADCSIQFRGPYKLASLVNDSDLCWLDDELVVLFAAAEILAGVKAEDAESKLKLAQGYLLRLKGRVKATSKRYTVGLGSVDAGRSITQGVSVNVTPRTT